MIAFVSILENLVGDHALYFLPNHHEGGKLYILMHVLAIYLPEGKEKEKKTSWGGDIVSRGTREPQAPT